MIESFTREIGGDVYTVSQFSATLASKYLIRLGKIIGGPMSMIFDSETLQKAKDGDLDPKNVTDGDVKNLSSAVKLLFGNMDEERDVAFIKALLEKTLINNKQIDLDVDFSGKIGTLMKVLIFVLEVNFQDFLSDFGLITIEDRVSPVTGSSLSPVKSGSATA